HHQLDPHRLPEYAASTEQPIDPTLNPLRIPVVSGLEERRRDVAGAIESLGHRVIQEAEPSRVGPATSAERPDVAVVVVGEGSKDALAGIDRIVHEATCTVMAILDVDEPLFVREAAKRGIFAYITSLQHSRELEIYTDHR